MKCLACKHGTLHPGHTIVTVERGASVVVVRQVPAQICDTCGDDYLDAEVAAALEAIAAQAERTGVRLEDREYQAA